MQTTWDTVIEPLTLIAQNPRPSWQQTRQHARMMLDLVAELRNDDRFESVRPFVSMATLCIGFPDRDEVVTIFATSPNTIEMRFYAFWGDEESAQVIDVAPDNVVATLATYIEHHNQPHIS